MIPAGPTRVTLAVASGARSVREVATACGWVSTSTAYAHLCMARKLGLVTWEQGKQGTLRALVGPT